MTDSDTIRDTLIQHACFPSALAALDALVAERDEALEKLELRIEDDAVYRVYDEQVARAVAAEARVTELEAALRKIDNEVLFVAQRTQLSRQGQNIRDIARAALAGKEEGT